MCGVTKLSDLDALLFEWIWNQFRARMNN
jgi:hypothetical protein